MLAAKFESREPLSWPEALNLVGPLLLLPLWLPQPPPLLEAQAERKWAAC